MTATVPFSIMCSRLKVFLLLPWLALARGSEPAMQIDAARGFVQSYCSGCHNDKKQKGRTNLTPFLRNDTVEQSLLLSAYDQLKLGEMPPEEEEQPSRSDRARMIAFLSGALSASGSRTLDKASLPGYGNYVNHEDLFEA